MFLIGITSSVSIITPAYPQQNSTFNVSLSTRTVMQEEFKQGLQTTNDIVCGKCGWDRLFEAPNFFSKYKHFIVLIASSACAEDQLEWCGLIESKVRYLIMNLERNQHIVLAHVSPECHTGGPPPPDQTNTPTNMWFIGLVFAKTENLNVDLTYDIQHFTNAVHRQAGMIKMLKEGMKIEARYVRRSTHLQNLGMKMDCSALVSQRLSLGGSCQLSDGERTYETYSYRNTAARSATIAVPSERNKLNLRRIPISGNIIVEESVEAVNNVRPNEIILEPPSRVGFPENLRVRHPLLGIDFSKQPRTAERIAESLPKKKKHSKKHGESYNGLTLSDMGSPSIPTPLKKKKMKKHRTNEDVTMSDHEGQLLDESVNDSAVKKKKKKKHKDNEF